jgi:hypothetical protein
MLRRLIAALAALVAMSIAASPAGAITFGHASGGASNTYDVAAVVLDRSPGLTPATLPLRWRLQPAQGERSDLLPSGGEAGTRAPGRLEVGDAPPRTIHQANRQIRYLQVALSVTSCTVTVPFAFAVMWARKCS